MWLCRKMGPFSSMLATFLDLAKDRFFLKLRNNKIVIRFSSDGVSGLAVFSSVLFSLRQTSFLFSLTFVFFKTLSLNINKAYRCRDFGAFVFFKEQKN